MSVFCQICQAASSVPLSSPFPQPISSQVKVTWQKVEVKVNKLSSPVTQLPYDYYNLAFCKPKDLRNSVENLGEVLHGSVIQNSAYGIYMGKTDFKVLCRVELNQRSSALLAKRIKEDYRVHMIMDNLPAATKMM